MSTFAPDNFTQAKAALDLISQTVTDIAVTTDARIQNLRDFSIRLGELSNAAPVGWLDAIQYINAEAAANPSDPAWQALLAEKDKLVADFQAQRTNLDAIIAAIEAV